MDSAQENFPHLWVNGEKYVFSDDVTQAGTALYYQFLYLKEFISELLENANKGLCTNITVKSNELKGNLRKFDELWTTYE